MNNSWEDFWADAPVISIYTDNDAIEDGVLMDISKFNVKFNGKIINRITCGAEEILELTKKTGCYRQKQFAIYRG